MCSVDSQAHCPYFTSLISVISNPRKEMLDVHQRQFDGSLPENDTNRDIKLGKWHAKMVDQNMFDVAFSFN